MIRKSGKTKVVSISYWYLFFRIIISVLSYLLFFVLFSMLFMMFLSPESDLYSNLAQSFSVVSALLMLINYLLYWKMSGIYINDAGDHIIKWGGFMMYEDNLLNAVVIANQIERGPVDQLLNMATLKVGRLGRRRLVGIRYNELESYNDRMRSGSGGTFTTSF